MSKLSEQARTDAKSKAERLVRTDPHAKVDASSWTPSEPMNADVQTGMRPISRRAFKHGGKVHGEAHVNMGRKPRKSGGGVDSWMNRNEKSANEERDGTKHRGGMAKGGVPDAMVTRAMKSAARGGMDPYNSHDAFSQKFSAAASRKARYNADKEARTGNAVAGPFKSGGRAHKMMGGPMCGNAPMAGARPMPMMRAAGGKVHGADCKCAKCSGGRVKKADGGNVSYGGTRPTGGRIARKGGGRAKKGMNVNIIIAPQGGGAKPPMPPPVGAPPPGGGPVGLHQGMPPPMPPGGAPAPMGPPAGMPPMARKSGGRAYPIKDGAGGGEGRLQKVRAYGGR